MPFLTALVDGCNNARAVVGTLGYTGPDGLGCINLTAHPETKVLIPAGTNIARICLNRTPFGTDKPPYALTDRPHTLI